VLCVFGTYLVRSGVVESLHAFGEGGVALPLLSFILFLTAVTFVAAAVAKPGEQRRLGDLLSREGLLVIVAWTLLAAESLFTPASDGAMPKALAKLNSRHVPANAMWLTSIMVQIFLLVTLFSKASYLALISLSTAMILLPYLFSAIYGLILALRHEGVPGTLRAIDLPITLFATVYCLWLLYAAGPKYLFLSSLLYAPGALLFAWAKKEHGARMFRGFELAIFIALVLLALLSIYLLVAGKLAL